MATRARPAILWSALAVAAFQLVGSFGAADNQPERHDIDALAVVLLLAGPAALAVRDRRPVVSAAIAVGAADVYVGAGYPYGPVFVSAVVALYAAVAAGRRRGALAVAGAGAAGFVVAHALDARAEGFAWLHLGLVAGWIALVVAVGELARGRREQAAARQRAVEEEEQRRQGEQRLAVARELHDVLAHNISLINVQSSVALHLLDQQPEQARPALAAIKEASREALDELRTALALLRDGPDADAPRTPAPRLADLDALVDAARAGGLDVRLDHEQPAPPLPAAVELAAYRIVQEALTNVARHAAARRADVRVRYDGGVRIEVVDDGVGGAAVPGNGIAGMRERAATLGGTLDAGPRPGGGFAVAARLPVPAP